MKPLQICEISFRFHKISKYWGTLSLVETYVSRYEEKFLKNIINVINVTVLHIVMRTFLFIFLIFMYIILLHT